jgi:hypothetical protein
MNPQRESLSKDNSLFHALINANPDWAFIVNSNVQIVDFNTQVFTDFGDDKNILNELSGNVLNCKNAIESGGACGETQSCKSCVIRNSVEKSIHKNLVFRSTTKVYLKQGKELKRLELQVTAMPFIYEGKDYAYLTIENLNLPGTKRQLIPICSNCLKVRENDKWLNVDKFLATQPGINMTHSICPDCKEDLYGHQLRLARARAEKRKLLEHKQAV